MISGWRLFILALIAFFLLAPVTTHYLTDSVALADDDDDDDGEDDDDDDDDDFRVELILGGLQPETRQALIRRGFRIAATRASGALGADLDRVEGPEGLGTAAALRIVREIAPNVLRARNDIYRRFSLSRYQPRGKVCGEDCETFRLANWLPDYTRCAVSMPIGVIDTRVDSSHPSLAGADIQVETVRRRDRRPSGAAHGTGVVSLLIGQPGTAVVGTLPRARIVAVDAFHKLQRTDATDVFDLVAALDLLVAKGVRLINVSLSGPKNPVLERAITDLKSRDVMIVAAAGPSHAASLGYPARYPGVVAVSAVDVNLRPSRVSARGDHIAFAAPGVGLIAAQPGGGTRQVDGTSFAAPFVTAALAAAAGGRDAHSADGPAGLLQRIAKDLGAPGRDPIFGWGLVQFPSPENC